MHSINLLSEDSLIVRFQHKEIEHCAKQATQLQHWLQQYFHQSLLDLVPAYNSLTIICDLNCLTPQQLAFQLNTHLKTPLDPLPSNPITHAIQLPCYYASEVGPDLELVAEYNQLAPEEVIEYHTQHRYRVYAIGFTPGFPYLGFLNSAIACPRRANPRKQVASGSVAIADHQTGIYPQNSPGGWNIIGRCPIPMFQSHALQASAICPLDVGDTVSFFAVNRKEFLEMGGKLDE